jgi:uncharacterized protein YjlB
VTDVEERLRAEGLSAGTWSNGPFDRYAAHTHAYDKVLVCVRGSIRFDLPDHGRSIELQPGDRLDLPAGIVHAALVGDGGVTCLEAHPSQASFSLPERRAAGTW